MTESLISMAEVSDLLKWSLFSQLAINIFLPFDQLVHESDKHHDCDGEVGLSIKFASNVQ